ncbi:ThiF family adenylyltransferase [Erysipelotrichaceae bacterium OttesenSCG-928-M19]|nr:ThiF family adenylyltransferase [Erysipelotrichaceae bacterium OttesenSCG-928-M19]
MVRIKRYLRNQNSISKAEQTILLKKSILVIGLGGLGSHIIEGLARIGIKKIGLCDDDVIEESNLNRQLLALENNLGQTKLELAKQRIKAINSQIEITCYANKYPNQEISYDFKEYDLVIDCLDSIEIRKQLEEECIKENKTLIYGTIAGDYGYFGIINQTNRLLVEQHNSHNSIEQQLGNPYYIVSLVAGLQLTLTIKVLLNKNYLKNGFYVIDLQNLSIDEVVVN